MHAGTFPILNTRTILQLLAAWVFLSLLQSMHFYFYYEQSVFNSVYWSSRDWLVWFGIFVGLFNLVSKYKFLLDTSLESLSLVALIAILSGVAHILIVNSLSNIVGTSTRPFWVDFSRLYSKRWLQYLFTFFVYWLILKNYFARLIGSVTVERVEPLTTIKVDDGKQSHWLKLADIEMVEAAGNYICFHLGQQQVLARRTLKSVEDELADSNFLRVSRFLIVNTDAIERCTRVSRSRLQLGLTSGKMVSVGRSYWAVVKKTLAL